MKKMRRKQGIEEVEMFVIRGADEEEKEEEKRKDKTVDRGEKRKVRHS
jgi:hypothetical protein